MFTEGSRLSVNGQRGYVDTWLRRIEGTDFVVGSVRSSGHLIEVLEKDRLTILLPRAGHLRVRIGTTEHRVTPGNPMAFRPGERITEAICDASGLFAATTLLFPVERLGSLAEGAQVALGQDALALRGRIGAGGVQGMIRLADDIFVRPEAVIPKQVALAMADYLDEHLMDLVHGQGGSAQPRVLPAFHRVRAAESIMQDLGDEALSMAELAQRLGVGLRSLQLAFREVHGQSPRQVLGRMRLERARRRLMDARGRDQVTQIAMECGFVHLSRFAQSYARAFGELPSETLARRRHS
jgi:AraC-like DNA-binding protein